MLKIEFMTLSVVISTFSLAYALYIFIHERLYTSTINTILYTYVISCVPGVGGYKSFVNLHNVMV